jgi:hypothetical protein
VTKTRTERRARRAARRAALAGAALLAWPADAARAQGSLVPMGGRLQDWSDAAVGSEEENYLRVLQVAGLARQRPWTLRPFGPGELAGLVPADARHPWRVRLALDTGRRVAAAVLWPVVATTYNSAGPLSLNDGPAWTGRGLTAMARGGVSARWRWFSARLEPQVAWAANRPYAIVDNGVPGPGRFGDALEPFGIDAPQRFGDRAFTVATLGQSTARVDVVGLALGISTANQWAGPALVDPLVLGTNAAGFPHVFLGTSRPLSFGLGTIHARAQAGRLSQSAYATVPGDSARRLATALTAVLTIRGVPGLELGGTRFFHGAWPEDGDFEPRLRALFQTFYGYGGDAGSGIPQNQLSSIWGRWVFPRAGLEVWGEFMRNDASADVRDLIVEPDHNSAFSVGARRVWARRDGTLAAVRFETMNARITNLATLRSQARPYQHQQFRQGHTERGQILGSAAGQGGLATTIGYDRYDPRGRWTVEGARRVVQSSLVAGAPADRWDVLHYLRAERLGLGRHGDLQLGVAGVLQMNRNFERDAYGVRLDAGVRFGPTGRAR